MCSVAMMDVLCPSPHLINCKDTGDHTHLKDHITYVLLFITLQMWDCLRVDVLCQCVYEGCSKAFSMPYNLTAHVKECHEGLLRKRHNSRRSLSFPCQLKGCDKIFDRESRLAEHMRAHNGDKPFSCDHRVEWTFQEFVYVVLTLY